MKVLLFTALIAAGPVFAQTTSADPSSAEVRLAPALLDESGLRHCDNEEYLRCMRLDADVCRSAIRESVGELNRKTIAEIGNKTPDAQEMRLHRMFAMGAFLGEFLSRSKTDAARFQSCSRLTK